MTSENTNKDAEVLQQPVEKKAWEPMKLKYTGEAKDLIQHGVAKTSTSPGDPGEPQKVPNH